MTLNNKEIDPLVVEPEITVETERLQQAAEGESTPGSPRQVGGAAVAGGVLGLVLGGPILAVVAAGGAALAATTTGKAGEVARASGDTMATAGDRLQQWNEKNQVTQKTSRALAKTGQSLQEFDEKHKVVEKTANGIVKGCHWVTNKLQPKQPSQSNEAHATRLTD